MESYFALGKMFGDVTSIYKNPTIDDIKEIRYNAKNQNRKVLEIRFIADNKTKSVYVADGFSISHTEIRKHLNLSQGAFSDFNVYQGSAQLINNRLSILTVGNPDFQSYFQTKVNSDKNLLFYWQGVYNNNWKWVDKYISGFSTEINRQSLIFKRGFI